MNETESPVGDQFRFGNQTGCWVQLRSQDSDAFKFAPIVADALNAVDLVGRMQRQQLINQQIQLYGHQIAGALNDLVTRFDLSKTGTDTGPTVDALQEVFQIKSAHKPPGSRTVSVFVHHSSTDFYIHALIQRFTGEYRYAYIYRTLLKAKRGFPEQEIKEPKAADPAIIAPVVVVKEPEHHEDKHKIGPVGAKKVTHKDKPEESVDSVDVVKENDKDAEADKTKQLHAAPKKERQAGSATVRTATAISSKEGKAAAEGRERERMAKLQEEEALLAHVSSPVVPEKDVWRRFDPAECFAVEKVHVTKEKDGKRSGFDMHEYAGFPPPGHLLGQEKMSSAKEASLLSFVRLLKQKLSEDPFLAKQVKPPTANQTEVPSVKPADGTPAARLQTFWPASTLFDEDQFFAAPTAVKKAVRVLQQTVYDHSDVQKGAVFSLGGDNTTAALDSLPSENAETAEEQTDIVTEEGSLRQNLDFDWETDEGSAMLSHVQRLYRTAAARRRHYQAHIDYLMELVPATGNNVLRQKLTELGIIERKRDQIARPRRKRLGCIAVAIHEMEYQRCFLSTPDEIYTSRIAEKVLRLELASLHLLDTLENELATRQASARAGAMHKWLEQLKGPQLETGPLHEAVARHVQETPPQTPPRHTSPAKTKTEVTVEQPSDEDSKEKKGKNDKNADKNKANKKTRDNDSKKTKLNSAGFKSSDLKKKTK